MKIRIFALAKELGLDSKDLIQHCNDAGLDVKSSPLASITPEEREVLMKHLQSLGAGGGNVDPPQSKAPSADELRRERAQERQIRDLGPLSSSMRARRPPRKESAVMSDEETTTVVPEAAQPPSAEVPEAAEEHRAAETGVPSQPALAPPIESPDVSSPGSLNLEAAIASAKAKKDQKPPQSAPPQPEPVPTAPPQSTTPESDAEVGEAELERVDLEEAETASQEGVEQELAARLDAESGDASSKESEESSDSGVVSTPEMVSRPTPMNRGDYISPTGKSVETSPGHVREMKPHGSVRPSEDRASPPQRKEKKRGPSLPALATPSFKPPVARKADEGPVQKPDLALTGDVLKKNKLADILRKNRDEHRKGGDEEEGSSAGRRPSRSMGLEEAREARRKRRQKSRVPEDDESVIVKSPKRARRGSGNVERKTSATVAVPITVRSLSEAMGRPARDLITALFKQGQMITINDTLEEDVALELALELGVDLTIEHEADVEDQLFDRFEADYSEEFEAVHRPPVITVLGHVDHGKTTLVDRIRSSNVVAGEAGGITQHIAAYQVEHNGKKLTFVDTPGHAAFGEMRARGANVTDIVVLVVAGDDGVMPQTLECISHAKAAGAPIIVAMNKCDLPTINEQKVLTELSQHGILPSEWGGDVEVVRVSALTGTGVDDLLETILLTAELHELTAPENCPADGVCLEAFMDEGRGPIAWAIVRRGTVRKGDVVLCGSAYGRVRAMYTDQGEEITEAGPSMPIKIAGLASVPGAGDQFFVMDDIEEARVVAEERHTRGRTHLLAGRGGPMSLETFFATRDGKLKDLPLIVKADTPGSLEAIRGELDKFEHEEVRIKIIHEGVGGVNESDVYLAASSGAIIIAFHVIPEDRAERLASQEGVEIRRYTIIYNVIDEIRMALEGLLEPEQVEVPTGRALVLRTFQISRVGTVAGCRVLNGAIDRNNRVHVIRDQTILNDYPIASLKREKDDAKEVREGYECGIRLDGFNDVKEGDLLEAYRIEHRKRTLDE
ncbi:MAG: translation initiation factor IF-2 [Planctomycetaceae bacterium]|nr:translation initiation factor IF-2 [Planctomycetaceae bacterium]